MNLQQAKIILEKINRLYQSMALDEKNIDVFEQDLMLSYVKQLYETFSADTNGQQEPIRQAIPRRETPVLAEKNRQAEVIVEEPKVIREEPRAIREEPKVVKEEPSPAPIVREAPKVVIPEPVAPKVETPPPPPVYVAPPTPAKKDTPEYDELFEQQEAKELSEKLSSQPLRDLNKALGINEKFLTINELFNKDSHAYQTAITQLNNLSSFEAAKPVLADLAEKFGWTEKGKKKKAQVFIKTVRRRYL